MDLCLAGPSKAVSGPGGKRRPKKKAGKGKKSIPFDHGHGRVIVLNLNRTCAAALPSSSKQTRSNSKGSPGYDSGSEDYTDGDSDDEVGCPCAVKLGAPCSDCG